MTAPDSPELADGAVRKAAAYVHVPFCSVRCPYCDFAVVEGTTMADRYFAALATEIEARPPFRPLDAVFFGGGTPSLVGAEPLTDIVEQLDHRFGLEAGCEISLEANPEDWSAPLADQLVAGGFTRVSFGAQSWDPKVLAALGRRHEPDQIGEAVAAAQVAGVGSVSVDLIFGDPCETESSWAATVDAAIAAGVDHVSTYALTVEPGTDLFAAVRGGAAAPDDDVQADRYETAAGLLSAAGFVRYEVSNHAQSGHACRYNLIVWGRGEYLGLGMAAHGFEGGRRHRNARVLAEYLDRIEASGNAEVGVEILDDAEADRERVFVGLRRAAGVPLDGIAATFLTSAEGRRLEAAGVIAAEEGRLRVLEPLLTDMVSRALLG